MNDSLIERNTIVKLTFEFSIDIIDYCETLEKNRKYVIANQLLKSGTSIGANVWEAQNAESKNDFIHKFKIAGKESEEATYWLLLCKHSKNYPDVSSLLEKINSIARVINKIISTSKTTRENLIS